jgi:hypothetical protein
LTKLSIAIVGLRSEGSLPCDLVRRENSLMA